MKAKFFLFFLILVPCFIINAQNSDSEDFKTYFFSANEYVGSCFKSKDYQCAIDKLSEVEKKYYNLSGAQRTEYIAALQNIYYNLTCAYAMSDKVDDALKAFRKAIDNGYTNYNHAKQDTDLDALRNNDEFNKLLASIREKGDYLYILKKAGPYAQLPAFTYEDASSPELAKIRKYFNLDSIAGNGTEVSRILNMMTWAHNTIRHNGSYMPNTERRSAIDFYEHNKANNNKGINCRALAIFLNECYLSMGIKSRYVTCLPKNEDDMDCHVINSVYSESLGKWIWIDPSFNAYVKDDKGNMLSICEVRKRLLNDLPVFINDEANWNNERKYSKEDYIDGYMAKNLYWFQCPAESKCNTDMTKEYNCFIALLPSGYSKKYIDSLVYYTHDDNYFWEE